MSTRTAHLPRLLVLAVAALAAAIATLGVQAAAAPTAARAEMVKSATGLRTISAPEMYQVRRINSFRRARGLRPLRLDGRLTRVATWMALDMGRKGYFGHDDSFGRDPFQRMSAFRYPSNTWRGENLAAGYPDVRRTYRQWLTSRPHRANWLNPRFTVVGIARVRVPGSRYGYYWVTEFGSRLVERPR